MTWEKCPKCGGEMQVLRDDWLDTGELIRIVQCDECRKRFTCGGQVDWDELIPSMD